MKEATLIWQTSTNEFINFFNKYLLGVYYKPGTVLGAEK